VRLRLCQTLIDMRSTRRVVRVISPQAAPEYDRDFWNERPQPARNRRRRAVRAQRISRMRAVAALVLVGGLAIAWGLTARRPAPRAAGPEPTNAPTITSGSSTVPEPGRARRASLRSRLPVDARCIEERGTTEMARCSVAQVSVEYRLVPADALRSAYLTAVLPGFAGGPATLAAGSGPPACARGAEDERAWSRPAQPKRAVGRYACRIEQGRAAMWWTVEDRGILAHAAAPDTDLTSLFAWWESHAER